MKSSGYARLLGGAVLAASLGCGAPQTTAGRSGTAEARSAGTSVQSAAALDPERSRLEDVVYEFQRAYVSARPLFSLKEGEKHNYRMCEAVAIDMDYFAQLMLEKDIKEFLPAGPVFHRDIKFIARHAHDLSVAAAEHRAEEMKKSWERLAATVERAMPPKVSIDGTVERPNVIGEKCRGIELDPFGEAMAAEKGKETARPEGAGEGKAEEKKPAAGEATSR
jgi:hypothetical protein